MARVESMSHSGIRCSANVREAKEFYETVLEGEPHNWIGLNTDDLLHARGPHPCVLVGDFLFVTFPRVQRSDGAAQPARLRGVGGARHAFVVERDRFGDFVDHLRGGGVAFEGPITHPEQGPLGESVYFTDPIGNFFEVCWRRDEGREYHPVMVGGD